MSKRFPDHPGAKGDSETGFVAADKCASQAVTWRAKVLEQLDHGPQTAEEIAEAIGHHWYTTRPRVSELKAMGLVVDTGKRGKGALGGKVIVWRRATAGEQREFLAREAENVARLARALDGEAQR